MNASAVSVLETFYWVFSVCSGHHLFRPGEILISNTVSLHVKAQLS